MHPMMGLAALRGCIAVKYRSGGIRITHTLRDGAKAIYDGRTRGNVYERLAGMSYYEPASLVDFTDWDTVTEADLDWICRDDP